MKTICGFAALVCLVSAAYASIPSYNYQGCAQKLKNRGLSACPNVAIKDEVTAESCNGANPYDFRAVAACANDKTRECKVYSMPITDLISTCQKLNPAEAGEREWDLGQCYTCCGQLNGV